MTPSAWFDTPRFVQAVHDRMNAERVSCRSLAARTGMNPSALSLVLRGASVPSLPTAAALAVWAGLSLDRFLLDHNPTPNDRTTKVWEGTD